MNNKIAVPTRDHDRGRRGSGINSPIIFNLMEHGDVLQVALHRIRAMSDRYGAADRAIPPASMCGGAERDDSRQRADSGQSI
jgi:hypothetical protein